MHHADDTTALTPPTVAWTSTDYAIRSLIYASISKEILTIVLMPGATAHAIWTAEGLFHDNKASRDLAFEDDFRNTVPGDLSVLTYSQCLKTLTNELTDVG
ncbi:uncharacterized protein LOC133900153 [Phragmites australis]|uniref:uncharacterized protein LOC133900153 n=1 Tax=Phragmites australis TaxID=29695 RepID=UPI002D793222|nr:uncharacterized protein LOC133900153 [Phragmites australis]